VRRFLLLFSTFSALNVSIWILWGYDQSGQVCSADCFLDVVILVHERRPQVFPGYFPIRRFHRRQSAIPKHTRLIS
jgi:hypothetical protein